MFPYHIKIYQNTTILSQDTLRTIYFSYFHSILSYGIIFWGNSPYSSNIFKIRKRIIRIIMNARNRGSCRQIFKNLKILPLKSQYIFSLLLFVSKNLDLYESNSEIQNINTRYSSDLHMPTENLTTFQKGPFYFGIKFFNYLPTNIKNTSHHTKEFRSTLKSFLLISSFYSRGIFYLEFQYRYWPSVIILKVNI
jgi:hypothetical protein